MTPLVQFALILAIGALAGVAIGGDPLASAGLWVALVATFALAWWARGEEERDAAPPRAR